MLSDDLRRYIRCSRNGDKLTFELWLDQSDTGLTIAKTYGTATLLRNGDDISLSISSDQYTWEVIWSGTASRFRMLLRADGEFVGNFSGSAGYINADLNLKQTCFNCHSSELIKLIGTIHLTNKLQTDNKDKSHGNGFFAKLKRFICFDE